MNGSIELHGGNQPQLRRPLPSRAALPAPVDDRLDLRTIYFALRRQQHVIFACAAGFLALAIAFTAMQTPIFTASSRVVLNTSEDRVVSKTGGDGSAGPPSSDIVDTEVEVIRSPELALGVARALKLDQRPTFNPLLNHSESRLRGLARKLGLAGSTKPDQTTPAATQQSIVAKLVGNQSVQRIGTTYAFNIAVTTTDPYDAQAIANEYAVQYTQLDLNRKRENGAAASAFLASRLEQLRQQAVADTGRVQQYRIANDLLSTSGASLTEQEISSYNQGVAAARAEAAADQARLSTARAQLRAGSTGDDVGEALGSSVVSELRAKHSEVSGRLAALQTRYGPLFPAVQKARGELDDVDMQITAEIKRIVSNLVAKVQVSAGRLASIQGSLGAARSHLASNNRAVVGLDDLERRAGASQQLYDSYLAQYKQTMASQGTERPQARVISYAELPLAPASPRPLLNIVLALVIGTGVGIVIALVREMLYSGLSTTADVETLLSLPCLGSVPLLKSVLPDEVSPIATIVRAPQSGFAEAFRGLRTSIHYAVGSHREVLMITSALPGEGKTTIAACLARMAALNGEQAVLVDLDLRRRSASTLVRSDGDRPGLVEVLRGAATLDAALVQDQASGAWILPMRGSGSEASALIVGEEMNRLLAQLRLRFGLVLLDTAPILPIADTRALAAKVDAVILVARWRATADHAIRAALRLLPPDIVPIAGFVLSQVDVRKQARYGYGDGGFYYAQYKHYYQ